MKINASLLKNTVAAENQTRETFKIFENSNAEKRVLFLGNSITLHEKKASIGWNVNWGMAASAEEKDYVHIVLKELKKKYGEISYCIANISKWERLYWEEDVIRKFSEAKDFNADTVIFRFGENIPRNSFEEYPLIEYLRKFVTYFTQRAQKVIITDMFWEYSDICDSLKRVARENGYEFVVISDLGYQNENKAVGLFECAAVAEHPGDLGMKRIAERILEKFS
ncbi:MAG: SGNH/GDSL hydrolase family protein [Clostridia bacterium]|nr:SGNH/GDSL hydrolase family protein [Clostridia bacterium]